MKIWRKKRTEKKIGRGDVQSVETDKSLISKTFQSTDSDLPIISNMFNQSMLMDLVQKECLLLACYKQQLDVFLCSGQNWLFPFSFYNIKNWHIFFICICCFNTSTNPQYEETNSHEPYLPQPESSFLTCDHFSSQRNSGQGPVCESRFHKLPSSSYTKLLSLFSKEQRREKTAFLLIREAPV